MIFLHKGRMLVQTCRADALQARPTCTIYLQIVSADVSFCTPEQSFHILAINCQGFTAALDGCAKVLLSVVHRRNVQLCGKQVACNFLGLLDVKPIEVVYHSFCAGVGF